MRNLIFIFLVFLPSFIFSQQTSKMICEKLSDKVIQDEFIILMNEKRINKLQRIDVLDSISSNQCHYLLNSDTIWNHISFQNEESETSTQILTWLGRQNKDSISVQIFNLIMNSPQHKNILLNKKYQYFGLSISYMKYQITTPNVFGTKTKFDHYKFVFVINFL